MDKDKSYIEKFFVKCLLFLERQLQQRRHKLPMANQDESLHQTATLSPRIERLSSDESFYESVDHSDQSSVNEKGEMYNELKVLNGSESSRPKKSLFEITRVENTDNRGDSGGIDVEDIELDDTYTDLPEVSSPLENKEAFRIDSVSEESARDKNPGGSSNGSEVAQAHTSSVGLPSRFKIVKVARAEPYKRGRWKCQENMDNSADSKVPDRNLPEARTSSGNTVVQSIAQDNRDNSNTTPFPTKQERKNVEQKILVDHADIGNDNKTNDNSSTDTISETRGGIAASNQSLIENLESQSKNLASLVQR